MFFDGSIIKSSHYLPQQNSPNDEYEILLCKVDKTLKNRWAQNMFEFLYDIQTPWQKTSMEVDLHDFFF